MVRQNSVEYTEWKLTDEEKAKCEQWGCSVAKAQADKKRAYIANGGVILNPDALEDMYEALKQVRTDVEKSGYTSVKTICGLVYEALAKARE